MAKTIKKKPNRKSKDHNVFMRGIFSFTELLLKILNHVIPPDLKPYIDFSTLKIFSDTHISDKLLLSQSDTIYEAAFNENTLPEPIRHDPELPHFRFYFLSEFKSSKPSQPIDFPKYLVLDLQAMSDELIKNAEDLGELRAAFIALKHAQDKQFFIDNLNA